MVARRMQDIFVKGPHVQRNRDRIELEDSCVRQDEAFWYHGDEIGLRDHVQGLQVVRNGQRHVSPAALLPEPRIHRIFHELPPNDRHMLRLQEFLRVGDPFCDRVAPSNRARVTIGKETLLIKALERIRHTGNGNIREPPKLEWIDRMTTPRLNSDTDGGSLRVQLFQQGRK